MVAMISLLFRIHIQRENISLSQVVSVVVKPKLEGLVHNQRFYLGLEIWHFLVRGRAVLVFIWNFIYHKIKLVLFYELPYGLFYGILIKLFYSILSHVNKY